MEIYVLTQFYFQITEESVFIVIDDQLKSLGLTYDEWIFISSQCKHTATKQVKTTVQESKWMTGRQSAISMKLTGYTTKRANVCKLKQRNAVSLPTTEDGLRNLSHRSGTRRNVHHAVTHQASRDGKKQRVYLKHCNKSNGAVPWQWDMVWPTEVNWINILKEKNSKTIKLNSSKS